MHIIYVWGSSYMATDHHGTVMTKTTDLIPPNKYHNITSKTGPPGKQATCDRTCAPAYTNKRLDEH